MIDVLFFASLREKIGQASCTIEAPGEPVTVRKLIDEIATILGHEAAGLLQQDNTVIAVNYQTADDNTLIKNGDEVAFYPPVTGG